MLAYILSLSLSHRDVMLGYGYDLSFRLYFVRIPLQICTFSQQNIKKPNHSYFFNVNVRFYAVVSYEMGLYRFANFP